MGGAAQAAPYSCYAWEEVLVSHTAAEDVVRLSLPEVATMREVRQALIAALGPTVPEHWSKVTDRAVKLAVMGDAGLCTVQDSEQLRGRWQLYFPNTDAADASADEPYGGLRG